MRSDAKKEVRNLTVISELKTLSKKLNQAVADPKKASEVAATLISKYDKAVAKGVIPRGRADRRKSRITHFIAKLNKK